MISLEGTSIFRRVIDPDGGSLSPELARFLIDLDFPKADHDRFEALSEKAQTDSLAAGERRELEAYLEVDSFLSLLRLKSERSLSDRAGKAR